MHYIIGLGNPDLEYKGTRHNTGRDAAYFFTKKFDFPEFVLNKKAQALISEGKMGKSRRTVGTPTSLLKNNSTSGDKILVALPETFMNKSGNAVSKLVRVKKENKDLIVIHDDLDIPVGRYKISFGKNSGGHKGVESIMRALKTKNFIRIRIGICPKKKPDQKKMLDFIVGKFSPAELLLIKKVHKKISETLEIMITDSLERAMSERS
jgi:PTH1 family peptidyl-tRNA hydrolase